MATQRGCGLRGMRRGDAVPAAQPRLERHDTPLQACEEAERGCCWWPAAGGVAREERGRGGRVGRHTCADRQVQGSAGDADTAGADVGVQLAHVTRAARPRRRTADAADGEGRRGG